MSIATELTALAENRDAIKAAILSKRPKTLPGNGLSSFPAAIASIKSAPEWEKPKAWTDIERMLEEDAESYSEKVYILFDTKREETVQYLMEWMYGAEKVVTSDGSVYTTNVSHSWSQQAIDDGYGWVAFYASSAFTRVRMRISGYSVLWVAGKVTSPVLAQNDAFYNCYAIQRMKLPLLAGTSFSRIFGRCFALTSIPETINSDAAKDFNSFFWECVSLKYPPKFTSMEQAENIRVFFHSARNIMEVPEAMSKCRPLNADACFYNTTTLGSIPDIDFSRCQDVSGCFRDSAAVRLPSVVDATSVSQSDKVSYMFYNKYIKSLPIVKSNFSFSFGPSTMVTDKDSVATFTDGAVTGGFVGNLNTCPNSGQTITLNSTIKGLFTAEEQSAIVDAITAKGWTLSW